tara:strand:- start:321 stop:848 length:528 start_codon:yes stop_codon:yes gene_type:complete
MPASSKAQQRFFGVVKAMQKGDIPKKGRAGKIAKTMSKKDVDDFASTKHKGKPERVNREQKVRNLIKKLVREELKIIENKNIAKTILQQLGGNKFIAMTGAKNLGFTNNGLQMKIGRNSKGITHVIINLKSTDTYDMEFIKIRGTSYKVVKKLKGVYADQLQNIFTKFTGLRTRL